MSKTILIAGGAAVLTATAYYVSPAGFGDPGVPATLVDGTPTQVRAKIERESSKALYKLAGTREMVPALADLRPRWDGPLNGHSNVILLGDRLIRIDYALSEAGANRTAIDVSVTFPDSAFSRSKELHPYDLKAAAGLVDLAATEYLGSIVEGRRMASSRELEPMIAGVTGCDEEQGRAFAKRLEAAAKDAYGSRLKSYYGWGSLEGRNPYFERPSDRARADAEAASASDYAAAREELAEQRRLDQVSAPTDDTRPDRYDY